MTDDTKPTSRATVLEWMKSFPKHYTVTLRTLFSDLPSHGWIDSCWSCAMCDNTLSGCDQVWFDANFGSALFFCPHCVHRNMYELNSTCEEAVGLDFECDYNKWQMFREHPISCTPFAIDSGWYRYAEEDEDLCLAHGRALMKSQDPDQKQWQERFVFFSTSELLPLTMDQMVYIDEDARSVFLVCPVDLKIPDCIPEEMLTDAASSWFSELVVSKDTSSEKVVCAGYWWSHMQCEGQYADYGFRIFAPSAFTNIAEWVPFEYEIDTSNFQTFALVNCNPQSHWYLQVATTTSDDHGRFGINLAHLNIEEFMEQYKQHDHNKDQHVHPRVSCDHCGDNPITGPRYQCNECSNFDFCSECMDEHKRSNSLHDPSHTWDEIGSSFLQTVRARLGQPMHFG